MKTVFIMMNCDEMHSVILFMSCLEQRKSAFYDESG